MKKGGEPLSFTMEITLEDLRRYFTFTVWFKQKHVIPILIFVFGVGALLLYQGGWQMWVGTALLVAVFWYLYSRLRMWPRFKQAAADQAGDRYQVAVDDRGLLMDNLSRQQQVRHGWDGVVEARELRKYFLLYQGPVSAIILPKRSLTPEQQARLDGLLRLRLKAKYTYS